MRIGQVIEAVEPRVSAWVRTVQGLRDRAQDLRTAAAELLPAVQERRDQAREANQRRVALLIRATELERKASLIVQQVRRARRAAPRARFQTRMRGLGLGQHVGPQSLLRAEAVKVLTAGLGQGIVELPPGFVPRTTIAWPKSTKKEKIVMGVALTALAASLLYAVMAS